MEKEFVPYDLAFKMKNIGFDEPCIATYIYGAKGPLLQFPGSKNSKDFPGCRHCGAPTWNQAFTWFDENTEYSGFILSSIKENFFDWEIRNCDMLELECDECYPTRIEANRACLEKLCETLEYNRK